jgi:uncharacterized protein YggE
MKRHSTNDITISSSTGAQWSSGITVSGEVCKTFPPDLLDLRLGAETHAATAAQALKDNSKVVLQVFASLRKIGIGERDIINTGLTVTPVTEGAVFSPQGATSTPHKIVGYSVRSTQKVELRDPNRAAEVLDNAMMAGANFGVNAWLVLANEAVIRRSLLNDAMEEARANADGLARSLNRQLGIPISIVEDLQYPLRGTAARLGPTLMGQLPGAGNFMHSDTSDIQLGARVWVTYTLDER